MRVPKIRLQSLKLGGDEMSRIFSYKNMELILEHLNEGIQVIDHRGRIVYCNEAAARLDNVSRGEAIGKHILEVYPSLNEETSTMLQVLRLGKPMMDIQQTFVNYLGNRITTINSSIPLKEGDKLIGVLEVSRDITTVKSLAERVVELQNRLLQEGEPQKEEGGTAQYSFKDIIGESAVMVKLKASARKAAASQSSIMVYGSTGTGKELVVQSIHNASPWRKKPLISQNCAAIPASLLESILFGTVKGSFTGAEDRPGLLELANGGTLFLDEVNSMPLELQAKLLRVLEESSIRRVGDTRTRPVKVRIITAMNIDPLEAVKQGTLRDDLYYRLNVVSLRVPDLKERKEDIPLLVKHFIQIYNQRLNKQVRELDQEAWNAFYQYTWPGNVRELRHGIEGAMNLLEGNVIKAKDLPQHILNGSQGTAMSEPALSLEEMLLQVERKAIEGAMARAGGNITEAARLLQIPRQTLQYKLKKLKIQKDCL